jgi:predicted MPP superfamily phosphohydrolase
MGEPNSTSRSGGEGPRRLWVHVIDREGHYLAAATLLYFVDGSLGASIHLATRPASFEIDPPDCDIKFVALYGGSRQEVIPKHTETDIRIKFEDVSLAAAPSPAVPADGQERSITWLHLTDLHFNTDPSSVIAAQRWLWPTVRDEFCKDLERVQKHTGRWDLVFFSGDLAQSGTAVDYQGLDQMLKDLWKLFRRLGCNPTLLAVPGNHDLKWPDEFAPAAVALRSWPSHGALRDHFWKDDTNEYRKLIQSVFDPYEDWRRRQPQTPEIHLYSGLLPGDFSATYVKDSLKLGIVGLNSSWLQLGKGIREGQLLDIDPRQLQGVCHDGAGPWANAHDFKILVTHHPPSWLNPKAQATFQSEIAPAGRFDLHLYGHMHEPRTHSLRIGGGGTRRELQGASLFGLEYWETPEGKQEQRIHGYTAGKFEISRGRAALFMWPRQLIKLHDGSWRMAADQQQGLNEDEAIVIPLT